jgi:hypothetical protein
MDGRAKSECVCSCEQLHVPDEKVATRSKNGIRNLQCRIEIDACRLVGIELNEEILNGMTVASIIHPEPSKRLASAGAHDLRGIEASASPGKVLRVKDFTIFIGSRLHDDRFASRLTLDQVGHIEDADSLHLADFDYFRSCAGRILPYLLDRTVRTALRTKKRIMREKAKRTGGAGSVRGSSTRKRFHSACTGRIAASNNRN